MSSWIACFLNVITIFLGIPADLAYGVANLYWAADLMKQLEELGIPHQHHEIYYLVMIAPLIRLCLMLPLVWKAYSLSGRFLAALVIAEEPELLLARASSQRTEMLAKFSESNDGCCTLSLEKVHAMRYLMSEEERVTFVKAGGLGKESKAILSKPLTAQEQEELQEWEELADGTYFVCSCEPDRKDIVILCKQLANDSCSFWGNISSFFLFPWSLSPIIPLPPRFLWVYKLQFWSAISTFITYGLSVQAGKHEWWSPFKLVSMVMAVKYLIGLRSLSVLWLQYPLEHYGMMLTGRFPASNMWDSWCGAVIANFKWFAYVDVWQPVRLDASESSEDSSEVEREEFLEHYIG